LTQKIHFQTSRIYLKPVEVIKRESNLNSKDMDKLIKDLNTSIKDIKKDQELSPKIANGLLKAIELYDKVHKDLKSSTKGTKPSRNLSSAIGQSNYISKFNKTRY